MGRIDLTGLVRFAIVGIIASAVIGLVGGTWLAYHLFQALTLYLGS